MTTRPSHTIEDYSSFLYKEMNGIRGIDERKDRIIAKFEVEAAASKDVDSLFRKYVDKHLNMYSSVASEKVHDSVPTVEDYRKYLMEHLNWMDASQKAKVAQMFVADANKTGKPQFCFARYIEDCGSEDSDKSVENVRKTVTVNLSADVAQIASKLNEKLNDFVPPKIEKSPLKRITDSKTRISNLVKKCSATIRNGNVDVDVSDYCRDRALQGMNMKPLDKVKTQYPNSSNASFGGETTFKGSKVNLELVIKR